MDINSIQSVQYVIVCPFGSEYLYTFTKNASTAETVEAKRKELTAAYQRKRLPLTRLRACLMEENDPQKKLPGLSEKEIQEADAEEAAAKRQTATAPAA